MKKEDGNAALTTIAAIFISMIVFIALFDCLKIFIYREQTKKASEAVCLAVAQDKLFFNDESIRSTASTVSSKNNCELKDLKVDYDEIEAKTKKQVETFLLDRLLGRDIYVSSVAKVKIYYPWETDFDYCDKYFFHY